ncbi:hypothetical protein BGK46_07670 [Salinivibrio sp. SS2]|nr:hypothetical protein BGK46_07670 [Salinivibrio sp. DV]
MGSVSGYDDKYHTQSPPQCWFGISTVWDSARVSDIDKLHRFLVLESAQRKTPWPLLPSKKQRKTLESFI